MSGKRGMTGKHANHAKGRRVKYVQVVCEQCRKIFEKSPSFMACHPNTKYCSRSCSGLASVVHETKVCVTCDECGVDFVKRKDHLSAKNYCTRACSDAGRKKAFLLKFHGDENAIGKWEDPAQIASYMASYRNKNRARINQLSRENQQKNPNRPASVKRYNVKNQALRRMSDNARKATIKDGALTASVWQEIVEFSGARCLCCGGTERIEIDHVVAISKGGLHVALNVQPLCRSCNASKNNKTIDYRGKEFMEFVSRLSFEVQEI